MQFEHTLPASPAPVPTRAGATAAPVATSILTEGDVGDAGADERWLAWRARGAKSDRATARTMKAVFAVIVAGISLWLIVQLLS
jgi:hypothetical protein